MCVARVYTTPELYSALHVGRRGAGGGIHVENKD